MPLPLPLLALAASALAGDVAVPMEPLSTVPWEAADDGLCGATTTYDGAVVMHRWWVRDADGRLVKIVNQQVGRPSITEQRFVYGADGRLAAEERWETRDGALALTRTEPVERDAEGRVIRGHSTDAVVRSADGRTAVVDVAGYQVLTWTFDEHGVPLEVRGTTNGRPEIETWHRDCSAFPPLPG